MEKSASKSVVLSEVSPEDFHAIELLYKDIFNKLLPSGFKPSFFGNKGLRGYKMENEGTLVGFLGAFSTSRKINGKEYNFYNCHTWIVKKEFRFHSLRLLLKFNELKNGIITNFTPTIQVYDILKKTGYKEIRINRYAYPAGIQYNPSLKISRIKSVYSFIDKDLTDIVTQHLPFNCQMYKLEMKSYPEMLIVLRRTNYKSYILDRINNFVRPIIGMPIFTGKWSYSILHYSSDWNFIDKYLEDISGLLFLKFGIPGLIISDDRLQMNHKKKKDLKIENEFGMYKSEFDLPFRPDQLYSEIFYLDIFNR